VKTEYVRHNFTLWESIEIGADCVRRVRIRDVGGGQDPFMPRSHGMVAPKNQTLALVLMMRMLIGDVRLNVGVALEE
jgi:hypothetical protein